MVQEEEREEVELCAYCGHSTRSPCFRLGGRGQLLSKKKHELFCYELTLCPWSEIEREWYNYPVPPMVQLPRIEYWQNGEWHKAKIALANWV